MYEEVLSRFPVLHLLQFSNDPNEGTARFPGFIGLIAAILQSGDKPCCVVLPDHKDVAIAVGTLLAITRLRNEFPEILRTHASITFKEGEDHVLVHPSGVVYRYEGFFTPELFKLKVIDRNDRRSLRVAEIARLEKTTRKRPKGRLDSDLGQSQTTILGALLGIQTAVNRNFLRNYVLVLGTKKHFVEALGHWTIHAPTFEKDLKRPLEEEVPFGKVVEGGNLSFLDDYVAAGEPLIAIASQSDDLAAHCTRAERFSKAVLVDEIEYLTKDFRAYDSITENQHTVILANDSQRESVRQLEERGCEVWRLTPDEILFGLDAEKSCIPLGTVIAKASNARRLVISGLPCGEENLDRAGRELKEVADTVNANDSGAIRELLYSLFRILMFCAEYLGQDHEKFTGSAEKLLAIAETNLENAKVWLPPDATIHIKNAIDNMRRAVGSLSKSGATPKGEVLLKNLLSPTLAKNQLAVVVARGDTNCKGLQEWLNKSGLQAEVYSVSGVPENRDYDRMLVVSWPKSERFDRLVHQYMTDDLGLLAYPFEEDWLNRYRQGYKRSVLASISTKRKLQRLGLSTTDVQNGDGEVASKALKQDL